MRRYTIEPRPYKVIVDKVIKWVPKVHIYIHEPNITISRMVTWKKNHLFEKEEEAFRFIAAAMENLERINVQLKGEQIAALKAISEEHGLSLAEVIRQAIGRYLPEPKKKKQ